MNPVSNLGRQITETATVLDAIKMNSTPFAGRAVREQTGEFVVEPLDPFQALDHLMQVAEALCPVWPERAPFSGTERMLL